MLARLPSGVHSFQRDWFLEGEIYWHSLEVEGLIRSDKSTSKLVQFSEGSFLLTVAIQTRLDSRKELSKGIPFNKSEVVHLTSPDSQGLEYRLWKESSYKISAFGKES